MTTLQTINQRIEFLQEALALFSEADKENSIIKDLRSSISGGINQLEALRDEIAAESP